MRALLFASAVTAAVSFAVPAYATVVFSENFDGVKIGNYGGGNHVGKFMVDSGDVDIIGKPEFAYACPVPNSADGNHCLDINGNTNGQISSDTILVEGGTTYTIAFAMAGNGEPYAPSATSPYTFDVSFAGVTKSFAIAPIAPFQNVSFDVTTSAGGLSNLVFRSTSMNQPTFWGAILDDVSVSTPTLSAVPEPASWAMLIGGFAIVGGTLRRRSARGIATA